MRFAAPFMVLTTLVGCSGGSGPKSGTVVGNGIQLHMSAYAAKATKALKLDGGVTVTRLYLGVHRVRLRPDSACQGDDTKVDFKNPFVANLLDGLVLGGEPDFQREAGPYCEMRIEYREVDVADSPSGTPAEMDGLAVLLEGERGDGTSFVLRSQRNDKLELEAKGDMPFALPDGTQPLFIGFELSIAVAALDLDNLDGSPIVIEKGTNDTELEAFEKAFDDAARLFRDANGDGVLAADERDESDELAD